MSFGLSFFEICVSFYRNELKFARFISVIKSIFNRYRYPIANMKWCLVTVGRPSLQWAKLAVDDYLSRLNRFTQTEWKPVREGSAAEVSRRVIEASENSWRVVLDEKGRALDSMAFSAWIGKGELGGRKHVSIIVGGADGHGDAVRAAADETWSLSTMTLQHELAFVVLLEQLYRAYSILRGGPYHRP
jgi:23S rRNA (pseudouridine1915-N3)-methyltransferase